MTDYKAVKEKLMFGRQFYQLDSFYLLKKKTLKHESDLYVLF